MLRQVVEKKFPFRHGPKAGHLVIVKANHEGGNDIEFLSDIWEGTKWLDSLNYAADTEQVGNFPEHRQTIHVQANSGMTEQLRDVEKISGAAAKIQNPLGAREIEFKLANPADVHTDPAVEIEIFGPVRSGICYCVPAANLLESSRINRLNDALCLQRKTLRA